jgi:VanZ family protein
MAPTPTPTPTPTPLERRARAAQASTAAVRAWRALLTALVVAVSYLALTPHPPAQLDMGWDKLNHVAAFSALALLARLSCPASRRALPLSSAALFAFGGLIEVLQRFVPGRSSEWGDLLADAIGIACGALIAAALYWAVSRPSRRTL